jgi:death-on-curing protein
VIYLDLADLLHIADRTLGQVDVRDMGLLESALARPRTTVFGEDAYPDLARKAAALTHSVTKNHARVDGNKRLALAALIAFLGLNGLRLTFSNDEAHDFIIEIADGRLADVDEMAAVIAGATEPW